jgi:hypothetical protein
MSKSVNRDERIGHRRDAHRLRLDSTENNDMEQQPATGTVSIAFVREVLAAAAYRGRPAAPLLASAQIPEALLDDPRSRVTPAQFGALWLAVGHALGDELFGLDARRVKIGSFALITRSVVGARNLREALVGIARFFQILLDDFEVRFEAGAGTGQEAAIRDRKSVV